MAAHRMLTAAENALEAIPPTTRVREGMNHAIRAFEKNTKDGRVEQIAKLKGMVNELDGVLETLKRLRGALLEMAEEG